MSKFSNLVAALLLLSTAAFATDTITFTTNTSTGLAGSSGLTWTDDTLGAISPLYAWGETLFEGAQFCDPVSGTCTASAFTVSGCSSKPQTTTTTTNDTITWTGCSVSGHTFTGKVVYSVSNYVPTFGPYVGVTIPTIKETVTLTNTDTSNWTLTTKVLLPSLNVATYDSTNSQTSSNDYGPASVHAIPVFHIGEGAGGWGMYYFVDSYSGFAASSPDANGNGCGGLPCKMYGTSGAVAGGTQATMTFGQRFIPTNTPATAIYSVVNDAYATYAAKLAPTTPTKWGNRSPIMADWLATGFKTNRNTTNPFGYDSVANPSSLVTQFTDCNNTGTQITDTALRKQFVTHACQQLARYYTTWQNYKVVPQGIVLWDAEGGEFDQAFMYMGDPNAFVATAHSATPYNPYLTALQAYFHIFQTADKQPTGWNLPRPLATGMTLRPQHITYYDSTNKPTSCTTRLEPNPSNPYSTIVSATGSITSGSKNLTITDSKFTANNPSSSSTSIVGQTVLVAIPNQPAFITTVASFTDANHLVLTDAAPMNMTTATVWVKYQEDFSDRIVVTDTTFGNKWFRCDPSTNPITFDSVHNIYSGTGAWSLLGLGDGVQTQYYANDYTSTINELAQKVQKARELFGHSLFYVDSNVWWTSGTMQHPIWAALTQQFPDTLFIPEWETTNTFGFSAPYNDPGPSCNTNPIATVTSAHRVMPSAFQMTKLQDGYATAGPCYTNSTFKQTVENGGAGGDIWSSAGTNSGTGAENNLGQAFQNTVVSQSLITVTDKTTGHAYKFSGDPKTSWNYPLVMRVYFAANAGAMASSTLYCEAGNNPSQDSWNGSTSCTLDLTGASAAFYEIRYYDFAGNQKSKITSALPLN